MPALMCIRNASTSELTQWDSIAEALEAAEILPCSGHCENFHVAAWREHGVIGTEFVDRRRRPPTMAAQLLAAGYRRPESGLPVQHWRRPTILNEPLRPRGVAAMTPETRCDQDAAVDAAAGRKLTPEPGGLDGHAARAHFNAATAFAVGDIDGAIGGDMLAAALSDLVLLERKDAEG
jgi:hypothetical protein